MAYATGRETDIAKMLESFIEENQHDITPNMFESLNDLAGDIDSEVEALENELSEAKDTVEKLEGEKESLEDRIDDLETNVTDLEKKIEDLEDDE